MSDFTAKDVITWLIGVCTVLLGIVWKAQDKRQDRMEAFFKDVNENQDTRMDAMESRKADKELVDQRFRDLIGRMDRDFEARKDVDAKIEKILDILLKRGGR